MFWESMIGFIVLLVSIIPHEFGHWIVGWFFGQKLKFKFTWYAIFATNFDFKKMLVKHLLLINAAGFYFGIIFIYIMAQYFTFDMNTVILIHLLMSCLDINNIIEILRLNKQDMNKTVHEIQVRQAQEILAR